jgi:hypothetical protein
MGSVNFAFMVAKLEYIEEITNRMRRAAAANLATPGRDGGVVTITPEAADEVMITGDLHGHRRSFNQIRKVADLAAHPRRHLIMQEVVHGGQKYDNGGCVSHAMLEDVAKLKLEFPDRLHFLLSNHELSELTGYPIQKGGSLLNLLFRLGVHSIYGPATDRVMQSYCDFIVSCPLAVRWDGIFACHSAPEGVRQNRFDPGIFSRPITRPDMDPHGAVFELVWGRNYSEENARAFAALVGADLLLHGHEPTDLGYCTPNPIQIIFDCCHAKPSYAIVPVHAALDQGAVVACIKQL